MITKLLKNQSSPAVAISIKTTGITIPASGNYTINNNEFNLWTTSDVVTEITTHINTGDIVVNDGVRDLTAAEAIRYIEKVDTVDIQKDDVDVVKSPTILNFEGSVTVTNEAGGKATVTIGTEATSVPKLLQARCIPCGSGVVFVSYNQLGVAEDTNNLIHQLIKGTC